MPIKLLLVEDHHVVRQGIKVLLESENSFEVVAEATNGVEALETLKKLQPDVVVMDYNMPHMNGPEATRQIKALYPAVKVLALSMHDHENYLIDMLDAGADGYVLKSACGDELMFAINKITTDKMYVCPEFTMSMLTKYKATLGFTGHSQKKPVPLTDREKDVLELIAEGLTNVEISQKLFTSVRTIETRRKSLLTKTGTKNTATLIKFAVENGLV